jgi:hypothetical protein
VLAPLRVHIRQEPARLPTNRIHSVDEAAPYTANLTIIWCGSDAGLDNAGAVGDRIAEAAWGAYCPKPGFYAKWP